MMQGLKRLLTNGGTCFTHSTFYMKLIKESKVLKINDIGLANKGKLKLLCFRFNSFNGGLDDMSIFGNERILFSSDLLYKQLVKREWEPSLFLESKMGRKSVRVIFCSKEATEIYCKKQGYTKLDIKDNSIMTWNGTDFEMWRNDVTLMVDDEVAIDGAQFDEVDGYCTLCNKKGHIQTLGCPRSKCSKCGGHHWGEFCGESFVQSAFKKK